MPTHAPDIPFSPGDAEISQTVAACPAPVNSSTEDGADDRRHTANQRLREGNYEASEHPVSDNTAAGMALMQEETMYATRSMFEEKIQIDGTGLSSPGPNTSEDTTAAFQDDIEMDLDLRSHPLGVDVPVNNITGDRHGQNLPTEKTSSRPSRTRSEVLEPTTGLLSPPLSCSPDDRGSTSDAVSYQTGIAPIDQELDWSNNDLEDWDFSHRRLRPQYPSATFQPYSKFKGTQQSDRQVYHVEVTILTVDIEQSSMSGYLQICGLTPDHPTLTTFFTGEIIGGPDQKYSFRTKDPTWGASDKTDMTHWARFPAWRPLSLQAKRNINFVYPMNHENWWQQEYIFMRWKEHFLVPDYKLKSIQGASFEGFYYICFNQIEGRVSGIYFHSKSEK